LEFGGLASGNPAFAPCPGYRSLLEEQNHPAGIAGFFEEVEGFEPEGEAWLVDTD
jgi:hypothetical protein